MANGPVTLGIGPSGNIENFLTLGLEAVPTAPDVLVSVSLDVRSQASKSLGTRTLASVSLGVRTLATRELDL